jgi:Squalene-hopene cyclase C-terminal domain
MVVPAIPEATLLIAVIGNSGRVAAISLGILAAVIAIVLYVASRSKWGQNKPLTKCITLAVLAHVWLLMYAYGTRVQRPGHGAGSGTYTLTSNDVSFVDFAPAPDVAEVLQAPTTLEPLPVPPSVVDEPSELIAESALPEAIEAATQEAAKQEPAPFEESPQVELSLDTSSIAPGQLVSQTDNGQKRTVGQTSIQLPARRRAVDQQLVPEVYQLRFSESRSQMASQLGGDATSEAAVEAALKWLASVQEPDGSWNAARHGAGRETRTLERDRQGTGSKSDTGMTALALLSFLGAGYTHDRGPYTQVVAAGLGYLVGEQMSSGDLAGRKQIGTGTDVLYARMYCHGMATLAIAEAYSMTGDPQLLKPMQRAAGYTLQAQNPHSGGWRYQFQFTGDPGDLSQFGWQAMALHSCENAGLQLPVGTHSLLAKFLDSVAAGRAGGLAVYRPTPGQRPTNAMTAEALAMRHLLNHALSSEGQQEANQMLLQQLPGRSEENLYYWYYATLALFQQQDDTWRIWNEAIKSHLISTQVVSGPATGSWDPRCIWAGYGGRLYSTTMSCLCLEVYYRYLPIYQTNRIANQPATPWR